MHMMGKPDDASIIRHDEHPICAVCGSASWKIAYARMRDYRCGIAGEFTLVRCVDCGLIYLYPRLSGECLAKHYPDEYEPYHVKDAIGDSASVARASTRSIAKQLYRMRFGHESTTLAPFGHKRMLDVGCGSGRYLSEMQQLGWDVQGVDSSPIAVQAARELVGEAHVTLGTLESLEPTPSDLDLITMNHVLEHMPDPGATLREVYQCLAARGKLRVTVPDISGFEARLFRRCWFGLDTPRHLYQFSPATLGALLRRTGFYVESCRPQYFPRLWPRSFERVLQLSLHVRNAGVRHILAEPLLVPAVVSYLVGNRGAIDVMARKA